MLEYEWTRQSLLLISFIILSFSVRFILYYGQEFVSIPRLVPSDSYEIYHAPEGGTESDLKNSRVYLI